jgi:hypothetical protein
LATLHPKRFALPGVKRNKNEQILSFGTLYMHVNNHLSLWQVSQKRRFLRSPTISLAILLTNFGWLPTEISASGTLTGKIQQFAQLTFERCPKHKLGRVLD